MVWECVELGIVERGRFGVSIRVVCAMIYDGMVVGGVYGISMTMYELDWLSSKFCLVIIIIIILTFLLFN